MIIDAHTHFGPSLMSDRPMAPVAPASTVEQFIELLDGAGIDRAVVLAPPWRGGPDGSDFIDPNYERANAAIAEGVKTFPDRLIGFARVNPKFGTQAVREIDRCLDEYGFRGLHLNSTSESFTPLHGPLLVRLLERCAAKRAAISVHTGFYPSQAYPWITQIERFPELAFILTHMGHRQWADAVIVAERFPNVYLETSLQLPSTVQRVIGRVGAERVIFGTNAPFSLPDSELDVLRRLGLAPSDLAKVAGENAASLLAVPATVSRVSTR